jgi:hypothetical protein
MRRIASLATALVIGLALVSCGGSWFVCWNTGFGVAPAIAVVDHTALPPANQVQFVIVAGEAPFGCVFSPDWVDWTVSDPEDVQIGSSSDKTTGVATCLSATSGPVEITGTFRTGSSQQTVSAQLTCR